MSTRQGNLNLYWGCAHTQFHTEKHTQFFNGFPYGDSWERFVESGLKFALDHIDFFPVIYYPAYRYQLKEGLYTESFGMKDCYKKEWGIIQNLTKKYYKPGKLVTFPAYEWTGNRTRWGDHNVIYFDEGCPLDLSEDIEAIYNTLRKYRGIAIPHHTGYQIGRRGKDWEHFDPELSPVAEIFSCHGSSEGVDAPFNMPAGSMGPRTTGGTIQDGLSKGCKFGIIASGDNTGGFPAAWGTGLLGIYAKELTREAIFEALKKRRTFGITGDRIKLSFYANNHFMGEELASSHKINFTGTVEASSAIDRIELIRNGMVIDTYCHNRIWNLPSGGSFKIKLRMEFGWGPMNYYGVKQTDKIWKGFIKVKAGKILNIEKCSVIGNQKADFNDTECRWSLITKPGGAHAKGACQQTLIIELEGNSQSSIYLENEGFRYKCSFKDLLDGSILLADKEESKKLIYNQFGLKDFENSRDMIHLLTYRIFLHKAVPESNYSLSFSFKDNPPQGENYYYIRVSQKNGQYAWSSPVWIKGDPKC